MQKYLTYFFFVSEYSHNTQTSAIHHLGKINNLAKISALVLYLQTLGLSPPQPTIRLSEANFPVDTKTAMLLDDDLQLPSNL